MLVTDIFRETELAEQGRQQAQRQLERLISTKGDWGTPDEQYIRRQARLNARLRWIPKDRKCPVCGVVKLSPGSWVVKRRWACCRSCFQREAGGRTNVTVETDLLMYEVDGRWVVDADELVRVRKLIVMSQRWLAQEMGWSRAYQRKLESGGVKTVDVRVRRRLMTSLCAHGVKFVNY